MPATVMVRHKEHLQQQVQAGSHRWIVDEPIEAGGDGAGPDPYALLLAALGACTSMTLMMYARVKQWPLESVQVELSHERIHATDCQTCLSQEGRVDKIRRNIHLFGPLSQEQVDRLRWIATRCPVHQTLISETQIVDTLHYQATG